MWNDGFVNTISSDPSSVHRPAPTNDDIEAVIKMATSTRPTPEGRQPILRDTRTQLFVGNLPYRVRWQDLKDLFRKAGTVLRADVSLSPDNRSRGYGTVLLATAEDAGRAVDMFNGYSWQTRVLEVRPDRLPPEFDSAQVHPATANSLLSMASGSISRPELPLPVLNGGQMVDLASEGHNVGSSSLGRSLFVGNLPFHCQWQDLKDLFRQAGTVIRADVALGLDGRSRGFGTVVFTAEEDAARAVAMFNGFEFNGRLLKVHHDKFTPPALSMASPDTPTLTAHLLSALPSPFYLHGSPNSSAHAVMDRQLPEDRSNVPRPAPVRHSVDFVPYVHGSSGYEHYGLHMQRLYRLLDDEIRSVSGQEPPDISSQTKTESRSDESLPRVTNLSESRFNLAISTSAEPKARSTRSNPQHSPTRNSQTHPAHPGNISLPSPNLGMFPSLPSPQMVSPLHHPSFHGVPMTPHGLPPMTPSMPPFNLLLQSSPTQQTPTISTQPFPFLYGPGVVRPHTSGLPSPTTKANTPSGTFTRGHPGFSLGTAAAHPPPHLLSPGVVMSPGAFWGRPGVSGNPYINPAVGAPVHAVGPGPSGLGEPPSGLGVGADIEGTQGSEGGYFGMSTPGEDDYGYRREPTEPEGYFPIMDGPSFDVLVGKDGEDDGIGGGRDWGRGAGVKEPGVDSDNFGNVEGGRAGSTPSDTDTTFVSSSATEGTTRTSSVDGGESELSGHFGKRATVADEEDSAGERKQSRTHSMSSKRPAALSLLHRTESDPPLRGTTPPLGYRLGD